MKLQVNNIIAKIKPALTFLKRYAKFIFLIIMLAILGFLVFRINQYSRSEPSDDAIEEKLQTTQRPKVDQKVLDKIQQLQDQNVQVQSLFDDARNNPFNE